MLSPRIFNMAMPINSHMPVQCEGVNNVQGEYCLFCKECPTSKGHYVHGNPDPRVQEHILLNNAINFCISSLVLIETDILINDNYQLNETTPNPPIYRPKLYVKLKCP